MEDRIYKVRLLRQKPSKRNPYIAILAMCGSSGSGSWPRIFKHRGIDPQWLLERDMVQGERNHYDLSWRYHWVAYRTWNGLIRDEYVVTRDIEWCTKLHGVSGLRRPLAEILKSENCKREV